jgi:hypothetical protein
MTSVFPGWSDACSGTGPCEVATGGDQAQPRPRRRRVGISFAGEVAYARMLHEELGDRGIHVAHTAIAGALAPEGDASQPKSWSSSGAAHAEPLAKL